MDSSHGDPLHPLKLDTATGEPYLQLGEPFSHIVLTPPRLSDWPALVENFNDPVVYMNLISPPYPFLESHAREYLDRRVGRVEQLLGTLRRDAFVDGCPVRVIRDINNTTLADAKAIGDCVIAPHGFEEVAGGDERARLCEANEVKEAGDPSKIWSFGDWLDAAHRGQGIMTAVVRTLLHDWAIPRMNAHHVITAAFTGNLGSVRVFEKIGFRRIGDFEDVIQFPESKGGARTGLHVLEWKRSE